MAEVTVPAAAVRPRLTRLRPATLADAEFLLALRNDSEARRQSLHQGRVTAEEHARWLGRVLSDSTDAVRLYIAESGRVAVGMGRLDLDRATRTATLSIALGSGFRGHGLGRDLVVLLTAEATRLGYGARAFVRLTNLPSLRAFLGNGFRLAEDGGVIFELVRPRNLPHGADLPGDPGGAA